MLRTPKRLPADFRAPSPPLCRLRYIFPSIAEGMSRRRTQNKHRQDAHGVRSRPLPRARAHWHSNSSVGAKPAQPLAHPGLSGWRWHTRLAWPWPGLLNQDSAVPGGLAAGVGDTPANPAALLTPRHVAASSRSRALTLEVSSGSAAARVRRPESRRVPAWEGLRRFRTVQGYSAEPGGHGRACFKSLEELRPHLS